MGPNAPNLSAGRRQPEGPTHPHPTITTPTLEQQIPLVEHSVWWCVWGEGGGHLYTFGPPFERSIRRLRQEFREKIREILEAFPVSDVRWGVMMAGGEHGADSHFVGHVKHQRGDRDEDQAHPEDA